MEDVVLFEKFSRYCNLSEIAGKPAYKKGDIFSIAPYQYRVISLFRDIETSTEGHIFQRLDRDNKFVLAFKGSVEIKDWFTDLHIWKKPWPFTEGETTISGIQNVKLHRGFIVNYGSVREKIIRELSDILVACSQKPVLTICGHSLGGALTSIAAVDLRLRFNDAFDFSTYTFGSPRVFNRAGYELFTSITTYAYRISNSKDPVPHIPVIGFQHLGKPFNIYRDLTYDSKSRRIFALLGNPHDHFLKKYIDLLRSIANHLHRVHQDSN